MTLSATASGGIGPYSYAWDLDNNGSFETPGQSVSRAFPDNNTYTVRARATDSAGNTAVKSTTVTISNVVPTASLGGPATGAVGQALAFQGAASDPSPTDTAAGFTYTWNFGDGSPAVKGLNLSAPTHTYAKAGTYTVHLTVTDKDKANSHEATAKVVINPSAPLTASIGGPYTGQEGSAVSLSAGASGGIGPYSYAWDLDNNGSFETPGQSASSAFPDNGTYTVRAQVTDSTGASAIQSTTVTVSNIAPTASAGGPYTATTGQAITLQGSATDPSSTDTAAGFTYTWDFGDGTTGVGATPTHAYAVAGTYTATVTASDKDGARGAPATASVTVSPPITISPTLTVQAGLAATDRTATCWYGDAFTVDVNLTDGQAHTISLYAVDWDTMDRSQRIDVVDAGTGAVLDSRTLSSFHDGAYLSWTVSGHVQFRVTRLSGANAVLSGLFFDGAPVGGSTTTAAQATATQTGATAQATYIQTDTTTQGNWFGAYGGDGYAVTAAQSPSYGGDGYAISGDAAQYPSYAAASTAGASTWIWAASTTDVRALRKEAAHEGQPIMFSGTVIGQDPLTYRWDFGDGATASGTLTPTHTYQDSGTYTATLMVTGANGQSGQSSTQITVNNVAPTATLTAPSSGVAGTPLTFSASATDPSPVDQAAGFTYSWDFGDGSPRLTGLNLSSSQHTYILPGTYAVRLTATDKDNGVSTAVSATVTVTATSPSLTLTLQVGTSPLPSNALEGSAVALMASASGGTGSYSYAWDLDNNGTFEAAGQSVSNTFPDNGVYTVRAQVTDSAGAAAIASTTIAVSNVAPTASAGGPYSAAPGQVLTLRGSATDPSPVDTATGFTYNWDFGDGSSGTGASPTHSYATAGTYTVSVTATDKDGATSMKAIASVLISATTTLGPTIPIDANWLNQHGPGPYYLDQASTTYVLQTDVTTEGTAFVVLAPNVTFDLNGHTVTYDQNTPPGVANGGFEGGLSPTDIPHWDVSGAPGAIRMPARVGYWGNWMLRIPNIASGTTATILSDPISIPKAGGVAYTAMINPKVWQGYASVTISVIDTVTNAVIAPGSSSDPQRGTLAFVQFTPATTHAVRLKVDVAASGGSPASVDLDHADLIRFSEVGIAASPSAYYLPQYIASAPVVQSNASSVANVTIKNGTITQGIGRSYGGSPIFVRATSGVLIDRVAMTSSGASTNQIEGNYSSNVTVTNSSLTNNMDIIDDRMRAFAAVHLPNASGSMVVTGNTIRGTQQNGIGVMGPYQQGYFGTGSPITSMTIADNDIRTTTYWTDAYGIGFSGATNFEVARNTIIPINGRGMYIDGMSGITQNGTVHDNYVEARERPNMEYGATGIEATALRIRSGTIKNIVFRNNTFAAYTGPGLSWAATGARISQLNGWNGTAHINDNSNNLFENNTFKGIVTAPDPSLTGTQASSAWGLTLSRVDAGTGLTFRGNTFESNVTSLNIGDNDSYIGDEHDVSFISNTVLKSSEGQSGRTYLGIAIGDWGNNVSNIRLIDMRYQGGATSGVTFLGSAPKDVSTGWLLNLTIANPDGTPVVGASVTLSDKNNQQVYAGTTDATGNVTGLPVVTTVISQTGTDPNSLVTDSRGPFTLVVTSGTKKQTSTLQMASDLSQTITLN